MSFSNVIWPESTVPDVVKKWVIDFFATADSKEEGSARQFADFFHHDGIMTGMTGPVQGRQAIYESRLQAWNTVESRNHTIYEVYTNKRDASNIMIIGSLESTLTNGRSFEMEFAAQALFQDTRSHPVRATHYKIWADKSIAINAGTES